MHHGQFFVIDNNVFILSLTLGERSHVYIYRTNKLYLLFCSYFVIFWSSCVIGVGVGSSVCVSVSVCVCECVCVCVCARLWNVDHCRFYQSSDDFISI